MVEIQAGKIRCTSCLDFHLVADFPMRLVRGRRVRSRWCKFCLKEYSHNYYNKREGTQAMTRDRRKLSLADCEAILADQRKGLAIAIDYNVSLSTVYKLKGRYGKQAKVR